MNLPGGVFHDPGQRAPLIAKDERAVIRIETGSPGNAAYAINDRSFDGAVAPFLYGDWARFDQLFGLEPSPVVYSGAEHSGNAKNPNITVVPNITTRESRGRVGSLTVLGSTMGHRHPGGHADFRIQEVYEFQSFGLFVLDRENGSPELWVAQDGDKVAVPGGCHMTLYNLGDRDVPLITLDLANPDHNPANKHLVEKHGPILLVYYDDLEVVFVLNERYVNSRLHDAGVALEPPPGEEARRVRIARGARLDLGHLLYEQLTGNPAVISRFARLGIEIRRSSPEAILEPLPPGRGARLQFDRPLVEAAREGTEVYRYFFPQTDAAEPGPAQAPGIVAREAEITRQKEQRIQLQPLNRPLMVVVEGTGQWVERAYRPIFDSPQTRVFYANDSRWSPEPAWAAHLQPWEVYLDKADPSDFAKYRALRPDVVFVVTPDFTHAAIARSWVRKAPLVFVEKPFDSRLDNIDALRLELGSRRGTEVLGLDHFGSYALPVHDLKETIVSHLGDALAAVDFYMTEDWPIERDRVRTLQYGLTLDMLPHFPALLTYFGDVGTIDDIEIVEAGQYHPRIAVDRDTGAQADISDTFRNETYSRVRFSFCDYSGNGFRVPCSATVGKGFAREVKYMEVTGRSGRAIRVDLNRPPEPDPAPGYPWDSLFFLERDPVEGRTRPIDDPCKPGRTLHILSDPGTPDRYRRPLVRERYKALANDLVNGTSTAVASTLRLKEEAWEIVRALDRIWQAIQLAKRRGEWREHDLKKLQPVL